MFEEEEYPLGALEDDYLEDELSFFHDENDSETPEEEFKVGSFDPNDMVDHFLLGTLDGRDMEEQVGDMFADWDEDEVGDYLADWDEDSSEDEEDSDEYEDPDSYDEDGEEEVGSESTE